jgi:hypothetical protein
MSLAAGNAGSAFFAGSAGIVCGLGGRPAHPHLSAAAKAAAHKNGDVGVFARTRRSRPRRGPRSERHSLLVRTEPNQVNKRLTILA